jgi:hypothetical protein
MKLGSFCQLQSPLAFIAHFSLLTRPDWFRKLVLLMTVMSTYLAMMWRTARSRRDVTRCSYRSTIRLDCISDWGLERVCLRGSYCVRRSYCAHCG